jgi:hypothetical protein
MTHTFVASASLTLLALNISAAILGVAAALHGIQQQHHACEVTENPWPAIRNVTTGHKRCRW